MTGAYTRRLIFVGTFVLFVVFSIARNLASQTAMETLSSSFTIEIGGKAIARVDDSKPSPVHATLGSDAAIFTLQNSRLQCGDWILARNLTEDRSLLPKKVLWFKADESDDRVQPVTAQQNADKYHIKFADAALIAEEGKVFAQLMDGDDQPEVVVKMQS